MYKPQAKTAIPNSDNKGQPELLDKFRLQIQSRWFATPHLSVALGAFEHLQEVFAV